MRKVTASSVRASFKPHSTVYLRLGYFGTAPAIQSELQRSRGLADPDVVILDPCCGIGAYLLEVARCIADELRAEGELHMLALELLHALEHRVVGFEILTAPFAIAQLQLYILLAELGVPPPTGQRLAIFLTNALTGWHDPADIKINFPEMREEFDASQAVKRSAKIIVILGNPPYDRFAGAAQAEEAELVAHYKGIELVEERTRDGQIKLDEFGRPAKKQRGQSLLYKEFGIRKQLLDDLYIRFLRLLVLPDRPLASVDAPIPVEQFSQGVDR